MTFEHDLAEVGMFVGLLRSRSARSLTAILTVLSACTIT